MTEPVRILVGVHFRRHFGGRGHVTITPGQVVLTDRKGTRSITHAGSVVRVERKRFEPPTGNHWIEITDGAETGWAAVSRKRSEKVLAAMAEAGFSVERV